MFHRPEVMVVPLVPSVGPMPPPKKVVTPLLRAAYTCCGEIIWMCPSLPAGVRIRCSPVMASVAGPTVRPGVTPSMVPGLPALPTPMILPSLTADIGFDDAEDRVHHRDVRDHQVESASLARELVIHPHAVAQCLAASIDGFIPVHAQILLDLDVEVGVTQANLVSNGGTEQARVFLTRYL